MPRRFFPSVNDKLSVVPSAASYIIGTGSSGGGGVFTNTKSVQFDGTDYRGVLTADPKDPAGTSNGSIYDAIEYNRPWSFSFWLKSSNLTPTFRWMVGKYETTPGVAVGLHQGNIYCLIRDASGRIDVETKATALNDSDWHSVTVVYDGTGAPGTPTTGDVTDSISGNCFTVYIDGGSAATLYFAWAAQTNPTIGASIKVDSPWCIGAYNDNLGGTSNFDGFLDEVAVWDVGLSQSEAAAIYNSGTPASLNAHSQASKLISWWRMGDGTGDTLSATTQGAVNIATNLITDMSTAGSYTRNDATAADRTATADCEIVTDVP